MSARDALRAELETLVADGTRRIRERRGRRARPFALAGGLALVSRLCPLAAAVLLAAWWLGVPAPAWPIALGILLACGGLTLLVLTRARLLPVARGDALALWDRAARLEDRLLAADEFLRALPAGDGAPAHDRAFVAAAIEDAAAHVSRARAARLVETPP